MEKTSFRMDNGLVEVTYPGKVLHAELSDIRQLYGESVAYLLEKQGAVEIIDDPSGPIKRSIIVK